MSATAEDREKLVRVAWVAYKAADASYRSIEACSQDMSAAQALRSGLVDDLCRARMTREEAWWAWVNLLRELERVALAELGRAQDEGAPRTP